MNTELLDVKRKIEGKINSIRAVVAELAHGSKIYRTDFKFSYIVEEGKVYYEYDQLIAANSPTEVLDFVDGELKTVQKMTSVSMSSQKRVSFNIADIEDCYVSKAEGSHFVEYSTFYNEPKIKIENYEKDELTEVEYEGHHTVFAPDEFSATKIANLFSQILNLSQSEHRYHPKKTESLMRNNGLYYSCFLSYSSIDEKFATKLQTDLENQGIQCWFAPKNMKIGDKIMNTIDSSILSQEKLLIVLSQASINSSWVEHEVLEAIEKENNTFSHETILIPLRIDNSVWNARLGWPAKIKRERHIGNFTNWSNSGSYNASLQELIRALKK